MEPLDAILKKRHAGPRWYRIGSVVIALAIHVLLGAAALVAPEIFAEKSEPLEFVAVTVVPA
ncbi:MAG: hypothetical protein R3190_12470, partial [Thermoanaerobaculia bacterium]|nr:hypothetical protein [Thermoanaerobaculia bacterium]